MKFFIEKLTPYSVNLNIDKTSTKYAAVPTESDTAKDFYCNSQSLPKSADDLLRKSKVWKQLALQAKINATIAHLKRRRLNKEFVWNWASENSRFEGDKFPVLFWKNPENSRLEFTTFVDLLKSKHARK